MPYGHDITAGMLVIDRSHIGTYRQGSEPIWLVEGVERREERFPASTLMPTYVQLRNAERHGANTTPQNSGWTCLRQVDRVTEAASEPDRANPTALRMDVSLHAFLRAQRFQWATSDDYPTVRDMVNAAPYDRRDGGAFLVGARPVTPHGLAYELDALSVCLSNLNHALHEGRTPAAELEEGGHVRARADSRPRAAVRRAGGGPGLSLAPPRAALDRPGHLARAGVDGSPTPLDAAGAALCARRVTAWLQGFSATSRRARSGSAPRTDPHHTRAGRQWQLSGTENTTPHPEDTHGDHHPSAAAGSRPARRPGRRRVHRSRPRLRPGHPGGRGRAR
ncbi:hypothetical protein [Streptomyces sp. ISL-36]|uniref:hypothetical protein n=1 Tax=Streptomyces sp. ISL-36 TaxID=2819182 RepID=UPI002035B6D1|nr:hypothetical protein [Streptomyces sp. ISL-36]